MTTIADLYALLAAHPFGGLPGPMLPDIAKSPNNVSAPAALSAINTASSPADFMNSMTAANSAQYENQLRQAQVGLMKAASEPPPAMFLNGAGGGVGRVPAATSAAVPTADSGQSVAGGALGGGAPGGKVDFSAARQLAQQAGFQGDSADTIAATALAESGGDPFAKNEKGEHSYGITQINADAHGPVAREAFGDPLRAMQLAYQVSKGGTDFTPWTMFKNGQFQKYLPASGGGVGDASPTVPSTQGGPNPIGMQLAQAAPQTMTDAGAVGAGPAPGGAPMTQPPPTPQDAINARFKAQTGAPMTPQDNMLASINPAYIDWARKQDQVNSILGKRNPSSVQNVLDLTFQPQLEAAKAGALIAPHLQEKEGEAGIALRNAGPMETQKFQYGELPKIQAQTQADIAKAGPIAQQQAPYKMTSGRPGTIMWNGLGQPIGANPAPIQTVDAQGNSHPGFITPPLPGAAPGATGTPGGVNTLDATTKLGPGIEKSLVTRADKEQEQRQKVIDDANAAQQSRATLMSMANEAGNFVQGPFSQHAQTAAKYLRLINPAYDGQVASFEDYQKNSGLMTRQATRELSAREAVQGMQMVANSLPNPDMSPQGLQRVQNELIGQGDYKAAKAQAQQQWENNHGGIGNVSGFETAWQKQASPYAFIVARMAPDDRQQMVAKLQTTDQGRRELARLGEQIQYLMQSGLEQ